MFGYFYNSSFRRYATLMGDLFSNIQIKRQLESGDKFIRVPITYASKEHFMMKLNKWTSINSQEDVAKVETILPRINLHLVDFSYNAPFKTNILNQNLLQKGATSVVSQYNPSPIKMIYELSIFTRYEDDMFQIVEQILPYFQPHFNTTMYEQFGNDIPFKRDIKIVLMSAAIDESIDGDNLSRRRIEWSLTFEVNGWMFDSSKCDVDLPKKAFRLPVKGRFITFVGHCPVGSMKWGYLNVGNKTKKFKLI